MSCCFSHSYSCSCFNSYSCSCSCGSCSCCLSCSRSFFPTSTPPPPVEPSLSSTTVSKITTTTINISLTQPSNKQNHFDIRALLYHTFIFLCRPFYMGFSCMPPVGFSYQLHLLILNLNPPKPLPTYILLSDPSFPDTNFTTRSPLRNPRPT